MGCYINTPVFKTLILGIKPIDVIFIGNIYLFFLHFQILRVDCA